MLPEILSRLRAWRTDERGQVAPLLGLALIPLMAGLGLILEGGLLLFQDRLAHNAADAGAYAGTRVLWQKLDSTSPAVSGLCSAVQGTGRPAVDAACAAARSRGYTADEVTVNMPPVISAAFAGADGHIEVRVERVLGTSIMSLVGISQVRPGGRAVGGGFPASPLYALYALSQTACPGMDIASQGNLTVEGGVKVNAECRPPTPSEKSTDKTGGGNVTIAGPFDIVGAYSEAGGGSVSPQPTEDTAVIPDPFGALLVPLATLNPLPAGTATLDPGITDPRFSAYYQFQVGWELADAGPPEVYDAVYQRYGVDESGNVLPVNAAFGAFDVCSAPDWDEDGVRELYPGVYWGGIVANGCGTGRIETRGGPIIVAGRTGPGNAPAVNFNNVGIQPDFEPRCIRFEDGVTPSDCDYFAPPDPECEDSDDYPCYERRIPGFAGVFFYLTKSPGCANPNQSCYYGSFSLSTPAAITSTLDAGPPPGLEECIPGEGNYKGILLWVDRGDLARGDYDDEGAPVCEISASCRNTVHIQGGEGGTKVMIGSLYDRFGQLKAEGAYQFEDAMLIFNVVDLQIQGDVTISAPYCIGGQPLVPRLRE